MKGRLATISATITALTARFFSWWFQELSWFVPAKWHRNAQTRLEARQDDEGIRLTLTRPPATWIEARLSGGYVEPPDFLSNAAIRNQNVHTWLFPSEDSILTRVVQIPASAAARFENLLRLEIDRWSPYALNEVYVTWSDLPAESAARRDVDLRLIPRAQMDSLRAELAAIQLAPSFLVLGPAKQHQIDLRSRSSRLMTVEATPILATVLLLVAFLSLDWWIARRDLEVWRERYRSEVKSFSSQRNLEERITKAITTLEQAANSVSKGKVLSGLSAAIPETDWLTEVTIKNETLTVRGFAADLDRLIRALEPLAADGNINLQGEVALDSSTNRQRFSIVLRPNGTQP
jgi:general secretion pathway protein L